MIIYEAMGAKAIDKKDSRRHEKIENMFKDPLYFAQRKLNGERLMVFKKDDEHMKAFGRGFSKTNQRMEKTGHVPHILSELQFLPDGTILDGEVLFIPSNYTPEQIAGWDFVEDFWACREIMGSHFQVARDKQQQFGYVHYMFFDVLSWCGNVLINEPYSKRLEYLVYFNAMNTLGELTSHIHYVPFYSMEEDKRALFADAMSKGLEGILFKRSDGLYIPGKKPTNNWIKYKKEGFVDVLIMGYHPAAQYTEITKDGKNVLDDNGQPVKEESKYYRNGWIGSIWVGQYIEESKVTKNQQRIMREILDTDGYPCYISSFFESDGIRYVLAPVAKISGMDEALRADVSNNMDDYLGKIMAIRYFEKTEDSLFQPQFEYFRDDKPAKECLWDENE